MNATTLSNAADWHATMAIKAYRKRDWETYRRHIKLADDIARIFSSVHRQHSSPLRASDEFAERPRFAYWVGGVTNAAAYNRDVRAKVDIAGQRVRRDAAGDEDHR